jgi:hypothetical protein
MTSPNDFKNDGSGRRENVMRGWRLDGALHGWRSSESSLTFAQYLELHGAGAIKAMDWRAMSLSWLLVFVSKKRIVPPLTNPSFGAPHPPLPCGKGWYP